MDLSDYELLPGVVCSVKDDEHLGRIKATVPGYESPDNMKVKAMPWVYPMTMTGTYQGFTKLVEGCKVWVLINKTNKYERWWWPFFELNPNTKEIVDPYDNTEVLISRDVGGNNIYIYYTDGHGIMLSVGETKVNITSNGAVIIQDANGGHINVNGGAVYLNCDGGDQLVPKGNKLQSVCQSFAGKLEQAGSKASNNPYTSALGTDLMKLAQEFNSDLNDILTENVYVPG